MSGAHAACAEHRATHSSASGATASARTLFFCCVQGRFKAVSVLRSRWARNTARAGSHRACERTKTAGSTDET
eukprot:5272637-Prymnesium_polylepis.1